MDVQKEYAEWLSARPESVQKFAAEFPPGCVVTGPDGCRFFVIGWTEKDMLIVSEYNPSTDEGYAMAIANKEYLCAKHVRGAAGQSTNRR